MLSNNRSLYIASIPSIHLRAFVYSFLFILIIHTSDAPWYSSLLKNGMCFQFLVYDIESPISALVVWLLALLLVVLHKTTSLSIFLSHLSFLFILPPKITPKTTTSHTCNLYSSLIVTFFPNPSAILTIKSRLGLYLPDSIRDMFDFLVPDLSANICCVIFCPHLASLSCSAISILALLLFSGTMPSLYLFFKIKHLRQLDSYVIIYDNIMQ